MTYQVEIKIRWADCISIASIRTEFRKCLGKELISGGTQGMEDFVKNLQE